MQKKVYIESYGCQMNVSDSEVVASILAKDGYTAVKTAEEADLVLLNTCSIREKAEYTVLQRINEMNNLKARNKGLKVGVLGCMAERMRENLLEKKRVVDQVDGLGREIQLYALLGSKSLVIDLSDRAPGHYGLLRRSGGRVQFEKLLKY